MATPQQVQSAKNVRGYSKEFMAQACTCGCPRGSHVSRTKACTASGCACVKFVLPPRPAIVPLDPREVYLLGTVGPYAAPAPVSPEPDPEPVAVPLTTAVFAAPSPAEWEASRGSPAALPAPATLIPREGSGSRCPFCLADDFETIPSLKCSSCKAWQHHACVTEHKNCAACNKPWPA